MTYTNETYIVVMKIINPLKLTNSSPIQGVDKERTPQ